MMQTATVLHDVLAGLLSYPAAGFHAQVAAAPAEIRPVCAPAADRLAAFAAFVERQPVSELEELFTRTFDINPACSLEVGWHLFGERYERGDFLVRMRTHMRALDLPESSELPDHLGHVLPVLGRLPREEAEAFAAQSCLPALDKMCEAFGPEPHPYLDLLEAIRTAVRILHTAPDGRGVPPSTPAPDQGGA